MVPYINHVSAFSPSHFVSKISELGDSQASFWDLLDFLCFSALLLNILQLLSRRWVTTTDVLPRSLFSHLADPAAVCGSYLQYLFLRVFCCIMGILLDLY